METGSAAILSRLEALVVQDDAMANSAFVSSGSVFNRICAKACACLSVAKNAARSSGFGLRGILPRKRLSPSRRGRNRRFVGSGAWVLSGNAQTIAAFPGEFSLHQAASR